MLAGCSLATTTDVGTTTAGVTVIASVFCVAGSSTVTDTAATFVGWAMATCESATRAACVRFFFLVASQMHTYLGTKQKTMIPITPATGPSMPQKSQPKSLPSTGPSGYSQQLCLPARGEARVTCETCHHHAIQNRHDLAGNKSLIRGTSHVNE